MLSLSLSFLPPWSNCSAAKTLNPKFANHIMAGRLERSFSFDDNDDYSLGYHHHSHDYGNILYTPPPYLDSSTESNNHRPPLPPAHRSHVESLYQLPAIDTIQERVRDLDHSTSNRTTSTITPGADNLGGAAAGGGIAGVAFGVANTHQRESGIEAAKAAERLRQPRQVLPLERAYDNPGSDTPYIPDPPSSSYRIAQQRDPFTSPAPSGRSDPFDDIQRTSPARSPGRIVSKSNLTSMNVSMNDCSPRNVFENGTSYFDNPYNRLSTAWDSRVSQADIDPERIEDDGMCKARD